MLIADDARAEVLDLCQRLIRVDTTNPPGRETAAAVVLRDHLEAAGVGCELVARDPDRANLVARIPGSGGGPSLAFVGHLDVVPADPRDWTHPPFAAVVDGDYLYGRGAVDMKNELAARVVAMARLARSGFTPRGDLWLLAVADEEDGFADVGMRWLLEHRPDIKPDYALNEGDGLRLELRDGRAVMGIAVGDKGTYPARVSPSARRRTPRCRPRAAMRCHCWPSCCAGWGPGCRTLGRARSSTGWSPCSPVARCPPMPTAIARHWRTQRRCTPRWNTSSQQSPASRWRRRCLPGRASAT